MPISETQEILSSLHHTCDVPIFRSVEGSLFPYVEVLDSGLVVLNPSLLSDSKHKWGPWQGALKYLAWRQQNRNCAMCGKYCSNGELHHGLASRQDARSWPDKEHLVHHSLNVVVVHPVCHVGAGRRRCYNFLTTLYGEFIVRNWLYLTGKAVRDAELITSYAFGGEFA